MHWNNYVHDIILHCLVPAEVELFAVSRDVCFRRQDLDSVIFVSSLFLFSFHLAQYAEN